MARKNRSVQSEMLDVRAAAQAFEQMQVEFERLDGSQLQPVRVDLQVVAAIAHSVGMRDLSGTRCAKLAKIAQADVFDLAQLNRLPVVALAAWHTRRKQLEAMDAANAARIAEATLREAQQTRSRMLRLLTHFYEDHPDYGPRIARIRTGSGYLDLANDLISLAELYEIADVSRLISHDPMYYNADDPARARQLAQELFLSLGLLGEGAVARWTDLAQRAWSLLLETYESVRAAGRLVFRYQENVDATYPSLVAASRAPATRAKPTPPPARPRTSTG